jgi:hypothetical protein
MLDSPELPILPTHKKNTIPKTKTKINPQILKPSLQNNPSSETAQSFHF